MMASNMFIEHRYPTCGKKWLVRIWQEKYFQTARKKGIQNGNQKQINGHAPQLFRKIVA
jgi:hypothetical protein